MQVRAFERYPLKLTSLSDNILLLYHAIHVHPCNNDVLEAPALESISRLIGGFR